jgi:hypothetical protein
MKPIDQLVTRALKRAVAYCNQTAEAYPFVSMESIAWRREGEEYRKLLEKKLKQPKAKGAGG